MNRTALLETFTPSVSPVLYPLSRAMIARLAENKGDKWSIPLSEQDVRDQFASFWHPLVEDVAELREQAAALLEPVLLKEQHPTTAWFLHLLQQHTPALIKHGQPVSVKPLSDETMYRWRNRGLIRYDAEDQLNYHTMLAVLIMRLADRKRERAFLPPGDHRAEPFMYVWRIDGPDQTPLPCGLPLSEDVPRHAFLYSHYRALSLLHPDWLPFGEVGSVRWRGTVTYQNMLLWDLSEQDIAHWDASIIPLGNGVLDVAAQFTRHTLANLILLRLASEVFRS